ncbi:MAG: asparagine synthase [Nitrososphaerota archaeon]|nr:asparagine synthase [Nitrososphaerota archaeon]
MELAARIDRSVARSVEGENTVAVAFSGGVDSAVLAACARRRAKVVGCTGYAKPGEEARSRAAAAALEIDVAVARLTAEDVKRELARMRLPFEPTIMDRALWCLYSVTAQSAAAAGARVLLLGQLADELFGGYAKYGIALRERGPGDAMAMMESDFRGYAARGRIRDVGACSPWASARFPYEDSEVAGFAASLPLSYKLTATTRKAVLRRAAVLLGVPEWVAGAAKKAAQYSSGAQKLVAASRF